MSDELEQLRAKLVSALAQRDVARERVRVLETADPHYIGMFDSPPTHFKRSPLLEACEAVAALYVDGDGESAAWAIYTMLCGEPPQPSPTDETCHHGRPFDLCAICSARTPYERPPQPETPNGNRHGWMMGQASGETEGT